jgi:hypothetical protein
MALILVHLIQVSQRGENMIASCFTARTELRICSDTRQLKYIIEEAASNVSDQALILAERQNVRASSPEPSSPISNDSNNTFGIREDKRRVRRRSCLGHRAYPTRYVVNDTISQFAWRLLRNGCQTLHSARYSLIYIKLSSHLYIFIQQCFWSPRSKRQKAKERARRRSNLGYRAYPTCYSLNDKIFQFTQQPLRNGSEPHQPTRYPLIYKIFSF